MSAIMQIKDLSMRDAVTRGFRIRRGGIYSLQKAGLLQDNIKN